MQHAYQARRAAGVDTANADDGWPDQKELKEKDEAIEATTSDKRRYQEKAQNAVQLRIEADHLKLEVDHIRQEWIDRGAHTRTLEREVEKLESAAAALPASRPGPG